MVAIDDSTAQDHYIGCMVMPPSRATSQVPAKTAAAAGGGTSAAAVADEDVVTCLATMRLKDAVVVYVSCERVVFMMSQGVAGDELPPLTLKRTLMVEEIEAVRTLDAACVRSCCGSDMCVCVSDQAVNDGPHVALFPRTQGMQLPSIHARTVPTAKALTALINKATSLRKTAKLYT